MRRVLPLVLIAGLFVFSAGAARANHRPKEYCSESGDVCVSVNKKQEDFKFRLGMAAKYFDHYKLCVKAPEGEKECKTFKVKKMEGGVYGGIVSWVKNYTPGGNGAYTVIWKQGGNVLGKKLGFHV